VGSLGFDVTLHLFGRKDEALETFKKSIDLNPTHVFPKAFLVAVYVDLDRLGEAKATANLGINRGHNTQKKHLSLKIVLIDIIPIFYIDKGRRWEWLTDGNGLTNQFQFISFQRNLCPRRDTFGINDKSIATGCAPYNYRRNKRTNIDEVIL